MNDAPLLPHFIIIGAMKSGTTTLYRHLSQHPGIDMSRDKETDFFVAEKNAGRGLDWYSAQFTRGEAVRGEASPNYAKRRDFPGVPERMAATCPDVRLIYVLRDPIIRAESQFRHSVLIGDLRPDLSDFAGSHEYMHIMDASHYAHQLDAYLQYFERDAVLVLDFDDLVRDPQGTLNRVFTHIGVAPVSIAEAEVRNDSSQLSRVPAPVLRFAQSQVGRRIAGALDRDLRDKVRHVLARGRARTAPQFPSELRERMRAELVPDVARLRAMTGMPFSGWSL